MPRIVHSTETTNLAGLLERVLDKGIVIAGDIKIKLVEIELPTINIRLLVASVDKAREMGIDWWTRTRSSPPAPRRSCPPQPPLTAAWPPNSTSSNNGSSTWKLRERPLKAHISSG